jgi:hypothetical protein
LNISSSSFKDIDATDLAVTSRLALLVAANPTLCVQHQDLVEETQNHRSFSVTTPMQSIIGLGIQGKANKALRGKQALRLGRSLKLLKQHRPLQLHSSPSLPPVLWRQVHPIAYHQWSALYGPASQAIDHGQTQ